jgi:hypothetical protein
VCILPGATSASASAPLYSGDGPRPGPDILYAPPAVAAQLQNRPGSVWTATPTLVSGTTAYRDGEFLYQDWIYDDHGAAGGFTCCRDGASGNVPGSTDGTGGGNGGENIISPRYGTYTYPQDAMYAANAADLVELRVKPLADATGLRVTLNSLTPAAAAAGVVAFSVALAAPDATTHAYPAATAFPHGAGAVASADAFLTVQVKSTGAFAEIKQGATATSLPAPLVDVTRQQVEVLIPHTTWDPGTRKIRMTAGTGVWDPTGSAYLTPAADSTATQPGGVGHPSGSPSAFFNIAFRDTRQGNPNSETFHPLGQWNNPLTSTLAHPTWWRDLAQGDALGTGDISAFHADVDFARMSDPSPAVHNDDSAIPTTGAMNRILASHFSFGQGIDFSQESGSPSCNATAGKPCNPRYLGTLQPYAVFIPAVKPAGGYGITLQPHALSANYNQYYDTANQSQFGNRGSIVVTGEARGPDGWYYGPAGADPFEIWADTAAHFPLDPGFVNISGFSMGGYASFKLGAEYPDLFASVMTTVGVPGVGIWVPPTESTSNPSGGGQSLTYEMLQAFRNVPIMIWNSVGDELVNYPSAAVQAQKFDSLGYRYQWYSFAVPPLFPVFPEHIGLGANDQYQPAADFLGHTRVDRDPAHVSYVLNPKMDFPQFGMVGDHAYWLSGLRIRDGSGDAPRGTIDVRSQGLGTGDPVPSATQHGAGVLTGGSYPGGIAYTSQGIDWGPVPSTPVADVLDIQAANVTDVTVNVSRARVDCAVKLNVTSDGPLTVHLPACGKTVTLGPSAGAGAPSMLPLTAAPGGWAAWLPVGAVVVAALVVIGRRKRGSLRPGS